MSFEEMVVAVIGISVAGVGLLGFVIARITGLIQSWINRNKGGYDEETLPIAWQNVHAVRKTPDVRLKNLEAILAEEDRLPAETRGFGTKKATN
ncbi:MAG: hypothetical protein U5K69_11285 [Balneolaceae bacterium]|nr:hypothetical protein [Balneolaceae bacterium]